MPFPYPPSTRFLPVSWSAMRRVVIDHAHRRMREKRGGAERRVTLHVELAGHELNPIDPLDHGRFAPADGLE